MRPCILPARRPHVDRPRGPARPGARRTVHRCDGQVHRCDERPGKPSRATGASPSRSSASQCSPAGRRTPSRASDHQALTRPPRSAPKDRPTRIVSLQPTSLPEGTGRPAASASTSRPPPARAAAVRPSVAVPPPPRRRRHVHLGVRSATSEEVTGRPPGVRTTTSEEAAAHPPQRRDTSTGEVPLAPGRPSAPPREPMPYPGARPPLRATVRPHDPAASGRAPVAPGAVALRVLATCLSARSPGGDIPRRGCRSPPRAIARSPVAATDRLVLHLRHGVLHRLRDGRSRSRSARSRPASDTLRLAGGACPEAIATHRQVTGCPPFIPSLSPGNALQCAHHRHSARVVDGAVASGRGPPCARTRH